ncbi:MAG: hypothetical protein QOJ11_3487 [Frankiales bacterium]|nr:hypothetical protein [Frankiales bacterium]
MSSLAMVRRLCFDQTKARSLVYRRGGANPLLFAADAKFGWEARRWPGSQSRSVQLCHEVGSVVGLASR